MIFLFLGWDMLIPWRVNIVPMKKGPLQKILDIQIAPEVFLGIYFDGLNAFKQQVFGCL